MRLQIAKLWMSKNIRTRDGARHFVTKITLPKASDVTWSWPSGWCTGLRSWLRGFNAQLGHLRYACTSLPQKIQGAIKWLEITKKINKIKKKKASDVIPLPLEKNSAVLGDLEKWSKNHWEGGRPLSPPVAAPLDVNCANVKIAHIYRAHMSNVCGFRPAVLPFMS